MLLGAALLWITPWMFSVVSRKSATHNREDQPGGIWFVHATDPHLFLKALQVPEKKGKEEALNQKVLTDMLKRISSLSGGEGQPAFLVLTGDFGLDPCEIPVDGNQPAAVAEGTPPQAETLNDDQATTDKRSAQDCVNAHDTEGRKSQVEKIAKLLGESPVPNIYLVAGNNDIAKESAGGEALKYFNTFIEDVQKDLSKNKSRVVLHNLTRGYAPNEDLAGCYADIDAHYRLIGFPSYSFKSAKDQAGLDHHQAQEEQFARFRQLLDDARKAGRKALVLSHTPKMDDPFALAQQRYGNPTPTSTVASTETTSPTAETNKSASVATWQVNETLLDGWEDVIASDAVAGVLAGHLHDSHKEIYRRPYAWSSGSPTALQKLFLAPPLAVKNQEKSPIQARGFSLVHLQGDQVSSRLFWYDSETRTFTPDSKFKSQCERHGFRQRLNGVVRCVWDLNEIAGHASLSRRLCGIASQGMGK